MEEMKFVIFRREYKGEDREFEARTSMKGAQLLMFETKHKPREGFKAVTKVYKVDEKTAIVQMWGNMLSPWSENRFEVEYDEIG